MVSENKTTAAKPRVVFVTGLSGAGLKTAINILEDSGIYCIDNLPLEMIRPALSVLARDHLSGDGMVVFGLHFHTPQQVQQFLSLNKELATHYRVDILYLTADPMTIEDRYGANRRRHPLLLAGVELRQAVSAEVHLLQPLEAAASVTIDTSNLAPQQLAQMIESRYGEDLPPRRLNVSLVSFGFKHGPLRPLDLMLDVRFLPNPFFTHSLRAMTGLDAEVAAFIFQDASARELVVRLQAWYRWLLPHYYREGKHYLRIGIGCTGGQHRSVAVVEELARQLNQDPLPNIAISKGHRDLDLPVC